MQIKLQGLSILLSPNSQCSPACIACGMESTGGFVTRSMAFLTHGLATVLLPDMLGVPQYQDDASPWYNEAPHANLI